LQIGLIERRRPPAIVILLDTNAAIWMEQGHERTRSLAASRKTLCLSPATLLELQFLLEAGRIRLRGRSVSSVITRGHWLLDDPPAVAWFEEALDVGWTRDPFDRLLVAHARVRGWKLASADLALLERLSERERLEI
jgi:PIN domain nuclease of toxin-antitoxin system